MGQPVAVTEKPGTRPGIVRFETNRNLTGMGHERFRSADEAVGSRPAAELARRLFATGQVEAVHVYLNMVTVDLRKGFTGEGLRDIVEGLYTYYTPGVVPPSDEELMGVVAGGEEAAPAAAASAGDSGLSEAAKRVPAHLLERSRAAKERWFAKQG